LNEITKKNEELTEANKKITDTNRELSEFAEHIEKIADENEKIQIAEHIHDDVGHTMTVLHTVSQMGRMMIKKGNVSQFRSLVGEGLRLCEKGAGKREINEERGAGASLNVTLKRFASRALFPVKLRISGDEWERTEGISGGVLKICKEAYHNTLSHTMADAIMIGLEYAGGEMTLHISDNGRCGEVFRKGFGLTKMEETAAEMNAEIHLKHEPGKCFEITLRLRERNRI
jgi:signal transduction histidine kinase